MTRQVVTQQTYPIIWKAFELIAYDGGGSLTFEGITQYTCKEQYSLAAINERLYQLSEQDFETLCCGEQSDQEKIASRDHVLEGAHHLLIEFWEWWS
jgi:hypothetical protein